MIARSWKCRIDQVKLEKAIPYLYSTGIEDAKNTKGFMGYQMFRRDLNTLKSEITLITFWESIESIKDFASHNFKKAKLYQEDILYGLESDEEVSHFQVVDLDISK